MTTKHTPATPLTPMLEDDDFLRWWEGEKDKYPEDNRKINILHVAQAAYAAWCAARSFRCKPRTGEAT
jgi:hypothetical protein